jgi:hypothetical protein
MHNTVSQHGSKAKVLAMEKLGEGVINDNSKRSISIRINTSDYGRIKEASRRLRVRESEVFRFLVKIGLSEIEALYQSNATKLDLLQAFAAHSADFVSHFNLNATRLDQIINRPDRPDEPQVEMDDLELLVMSLFPERFLSYRLQEITKRPIDPAKVLDELQNYLLNKYVKSPPAEVAAAG